MSKNEFYGADQLDISVERSDDETGAVILTINANGDVITIDCGRFQDDADSLRGELQGAMDQAQDISGQWEDRPDNENDGFVSEGREGYYATLADKTMPDARRGFPSRDIAVYELASMMAGSGFTPNAWYQNERGNTDQINAEVYAHLDENDQLKPLPGVRYGKYDSVQLADDDWPHWIVDADYGDLGVMVYTNGDPDVYTLATHDQLTPYDDDDEED